MDRFSSFDGVGIAYQVWGGPSALPPVVLHHGFVVDANVNFVGPGLVDALVTAGRQVVAPDARGHGASDKPHDAARYGEAVMARDLGCLLDTIGAGTVDLVGYSMGAVVSAIFASGDPRVRRLVLSGVGAGVVELGGLDTRVVPPAEIAAVLLTSSPAAVEASPAAAFRVLADAIGADRAALAAQVHAAHRTPIALDRITAPTLVLAGRDDNLAARPEVLAGAIPGARWRLVSGDHMTAVRAPAYAPAVVEFLAG
ncbi:alpha/beta fold hydrolase [Dactylosporangium aurantiacum]|uniref:Alpha/beta fold hydrolase n=1 Tax=Dactylosporangium aurantiacum TaxID=35754 RepID=A0A9Q9MFD7_9ACTN|nr:alpha/beta fold hydrolase [Dactylosporangium aurantiacum]MDG6101704.1 alpha/beta fold hydrolase [Dactylosporangium aurantiacum]UWZ52480.1 alpha/beta fold hydrolase [Dactylosporangium aurantiacum]